MAAQTDHIRLDAEHAARLEIAKVLQKISRRVYADAKAHVAEALASAEPGAVLDGTTVGEEAVKRALGPYLGDEVKSPIEGKASRAITE